MSILKKGHQPGVYVPLRALFLVSKATVLVKTKHISCFMEKVPQCKIYNFMEKKKITRINFMAKCWRKKRCKGKIY